MRILLLGYLSIALFIGHLSAQTSNILRVNQASSCTSGCDGSTWELAYSDLQQALAMAEPLDEIWVAAGVYYPHSSDRNAYFQIPDSVSLFGGFCGEESLRAERDWEAFLSILSGDIGISGDDSDNSFTVVYTELVHAMTTIDGFTISDGKANAENGSLMQKSGAGMFNTTSGFGAASPTIRNCTFEKNWAKNDGGALYNYGAGGMCLPTFLNCTFKDNVAKLGGAIYNNGNIGVCQPTFTNCQFIKNEADHSPDVKGTGGVMYSFSQGNGLVEVGLTNCLFWDNLAYSGGALYWLGQSGIGEGNITNCTFYGNYANIGGAIYLNEGWSGAVDLVIANSIFWASDAGFDPLIHYSGNGTPGLHISYSLVDVDDCSHLLLGEGEVDCIAEGMVFNQNPQFVNAGQGNFHLKSISPALNSGLDALVQTNFDIDGEMRIQGSHVDLGFDEQKKTIVPLVFLDPASYPVKRFGKIKPPIIYPNPIHETAFVDLGYAPTEPLHFDIFDALGKRISQGELTTREGGTSVPMEVSRTLQKGSYWLRLEGLDTVLPFVKI